MKRALVTGGAGFVGRAVVRALAEAGFEVHVAELVDADIHGAARVHSVDLMDPVATRALVDRVQSTLLVHAAWYAKPGLYWTSDENVRWTEASLALARAFADSGGARIVALGSCAEYDWSDGVCHEEGTPLVPATLYGSAKDALRRILQAFTRQRGLSLAWPRLFFLYGPNEAPGRLVSSVCASLVKGEPTRCTSGTQVRDFLHVDDAGRAIAMIAASGIDGTINVGSGERVSLRSIVETLARAAKAPDLARFGNVSERPGDPSVLVPDLARLKALGFRPRFDLAAGLAATMAWWLRREPGAS